MKKRGNLFLKIAVAVLLIVSTVTLVQNRIQINTLREQKEDLEETVEELNERIEEIKYDLSRELTDDYIVRTARDKLNMHLPGEIVFYYGN
ncbi:MAG: septum formation initiator family protein [Clostridia bacterium]|nr:septum formation initiator family protein [Clostridia bacterium]